MRNPGPGRYPDPPMFERRFVSPAYLHDDDLDRRALARRNAVVLLETCTPDVVLATVDLAEELLCPVCAWPRPDGLRTCGDRGCVATVANEGRVLSDEHRAAISATLTGGELTDEHRANISDGLRRAHAEGRYA